MRNIIAKILAFLSRKILEKYQPKIIGITGSFGKTSARHAIATVLGEEFFVREPLKNLNTPLGLALTIIDGSYPQGKDIFAWLRVFWHAKLLLLPGKRKYPQVVVLEFGIDRPGEMAELLKIVKPHVALLTGLGLAHQEFFSSLEQVALEKLQLLQAVPAGSAFVNSTCKVGLATAQRIGLFAKAYGADEQANHSLKVVSEKLELPALTIFEYGNESVSVQAVGLMHQESLVAAVCVAEEMGMHTQAIARGLSRYKPMPGRMNILPGMKQCVILEDSYNSSPETLKVALELLARWHGEHKIAVLGDMLELGRTSDEEHLLAGKIAATSGLSKLVTIGPEARLIARGAQEAGMSRDQVLELDSASVAGKIVQDLLLPGSVILVKGSQGMRLEKVSKEIIANPMKAADILPRQYGKWLDS